MVVKIKAGIPKPEEKQITALPLSTYKAEDALITAPLSVLYCLMSNVLCLLLTLHHLLRLNCLSIYQQSITVLACA